MAESASQGHKVADANIDFQEDVKVQVPSTQKQANNMTGQVNH